MNIFFKIAAGIVGGVAIIASLGGFSKNSEKKSESRIEEKPFKERLSKMLETCKKV